MYSFVGLAGVLGVVFYPRLNTLYTHTAAFMPLGDAVYRLQKTTTDKPLPYSFCVLHENERTGTSAIKQFMREIGGQVWELKSQGDRNVSFFIKKKKYKFDPNRIFTPQGVANTLVMLSRTAPTAEAHSIVNGFAQRITDSLFAPQAKMTNNTIVSVHNNTEGAYSSLSHLPDSTNALGVRDIYINTARDPDDFFYVTRRFDFNYLKNQGFNVILQDNKGIRNDGSLSVYSGKRRARYINIEAQHFHYEEQLQMLYAVHEMISKTKAVVAPPLAMLKPAAAKKDSVTNMDLKNPKDTVKTTAKVIETPTLPDEIQEDLP